jgi:hypothetical protein
MKQDFSGRTLLCLLLALTVGSPLLAKGKKSLTIYERSRVNDVLLEPGDYKVEIAESGTSADVMFYKGKKLIARATAQSEELEKRVDRNSIRFTLEGKKAPKIVEFRLAGDSQFYKLSDAAQVSQKAQ